MAEGEGAPSGANYASAPATASEDSGESLAAPTQIDASDSPQDDVQEAPASAEDALGESPDEGALVRPEEDPDSADAGPTPEPQGACLSAGDTALVASLQANLFARAWEASVMCWSSDSGCIEEVFGLSWAMSDACLTCHVEQATCINFSCGMCATDRHSNAEACEACWEASCRPVYEACTGLDLDALEAPEPEEVEPVSGDDSVPLSECLQASQCVFDAKSDASAFDACVEAYDAGAFTQAVELITCMGNCEEGALICYSASCIDQLSACYFESQGDDTCSQLLVCQNDCAGDTSCQWACTDKASATAQTRWLAITYCLHFACLDAEDPSACKSQALNGEGECVSYGEACMADE